MCPGCGVTRGFRRKSKFLLKLIAYDKAKIVEGISNGKQDGLMHTVLFEKTCTNVFFVRMKTTLRSKRGVVSF